MRLRRSVPGFAFPPRSGANASGKNIGCLLLGVLVGGNANNGANAGLVYANTNNAPSNANATISSQLC